MYYTEELVVETTLVVYQINKKIDIILKRRACGGGLQTVLCERDDGGQYTNLKHNKQNAQNSDLWDHRGPHTVSYRGYNGDNYTVSTSIQSSIQIVLKRWTLGGHHGILCLSCCSGPLTLAENARAGPNEKQKFWNASGFKRKRVRFREIQVF